MPVPTSAPTSAPLPAPPSAPGQREPLHAPAPTPSHPLGVRLTGDGADVAVLAAHADAVEVCVIGEDGSEQRTALPDVDLGVWHGHVSGLVAGSRYGLRVHGRWEPERGLRHNPAKLLLDPYARGVSGEVQLRPEVFGHAVGADLVGDLAVPDPRDSAPHVAHGVVLEDLPERLRPTAGERPRVPWSETVVYEAHVRGLTRRLPAVPEEQRGTYAALAHPAVLEHLTSLGVTSLELLPVHASTSEVHLRRRGLVNYWGYNTLAFNAPHPGYATAAARAAGAAAVREEFRRAVQGLHAAGIEVLLDVVYNHTCEEGPDGPHLSLRGLDESTYYLRDAGGRPFDVTGCGNSLDFAEHRVVQFALDSLRYWVDEYGVDGFRFDLMTTLARGRDGFTPDHPFLVALAADPVLAAAKLVAEPWDVGPHGWRTGQFPAPVHEWNDRFRDGVRRFWLTDGRQVALGGGAPGGAGRGLREFATRFAGSADTFDVQRGRLTSVNFVTAHDGFTLADLVSYDHKHNEANGEGNRDGSDSDTSWNHGVEGATDDPGVLAARRRSIRNLLGTLVLSTGVPMLTAGDEFGRSQGGNNNAYCLDDETSWVDWELAGWQRELLEDVRELLALRRRYPVLREAGVRRGHPVREQRQDLLWFSEDGAPMTVERWHEAERRILQVLVDGRERGEASVLVLVNAGDRQRDVVLPQQDGLAKWFPRWSSAPERRRRPTAAGRALRMPPWSLRVLTSA
ncbi:glycogen debranching protein GlgX [Kineococcus sp. T13]|uniref:glycogen debranching protein GlgX n=1 Tax=Kineococcus vitellinus TaxID=2696565 RepID=UPI001411DF8E|nr:glycogen debranching protein GlgX [Kineococcus vitellinus]